MESGLICTHTNLFNCFRLTNRVIMGNANSIDIIVNIANRGEDAYETYLYIDLPKGVEYGGIRNQEVSRF